MNKKYLDSLSYNVVGAAIEVHKTIGPGLLSEVYLECMKRELDLRGIRYMSKVRVPVEFKGVKLSTELWCDLFLDRCVSVTVLSSTAIAPIHSAQMLTYMSLLGAPKGVVINFNCVNIFREGQKTLVNELYRALPND